MQSASESRKHLKTTSRNSIQRAFALIAVLSIALFVGASFVSATLLTNIEGINSTAGDPLNISADTNFENNRVYNASEFNLNSGYKIDDYIFYEDPANVPILEYDDQNAEWIIRNSDLDINSNNVDGINQIQNYYGSCSGSNVIAGINPNGTFNCVSPESTDSIENLAATLEAGNTANQSIDMSNNSISDISLLDGGGDAIKFGDDVNFNGNQLSGVSLVERADTDIGFDVDSGQFASNSLVGTTSNNIAFSVDSNGNSNGEFSIVKGLSSPTDTASTQLFNIDNSGTATFNGLIDANENNINNVQRLSSRPSTGTVLNSFSLTDKGFEVLVKKDIGYVASYDNNSLTSLDLSDDSNPVKMDSIPVNGAINMYEYGDYVLVAAEKENDIKIVDTSDPSNLNIVGNYNIGSTPGKFEVNGKYGFFSTHSGDIQIADLSYPTNPTRVTSFTDTDLGDTTDITVQGDIAFVTDRSSDSIVALDVSDPSSVSKISSLSSANIADPFGLEIRGSKAYLASRNADALTVVDVSNPSSMNQESVTTGSFNQPIDIHLAADTAYMSGKNGNFVAIDISDPSNPSVLYTLPYGEWNFGISGDKIYLPHTDGTLKTINLAGLKAPSANIGSLESSQILVNELLSTTRLNVRQGASFGTQGISSDGPISTNDDLSISGQLSVGSTQCANDEFLDGSGDCESLSSAGETDNQSLSDVLDEGNSAGGYNIDMNGNSITDLENLSFGQDGDELTFEWDEVDDRLNLVKQNNGETVIEFLPSEKMRLGTADVKKVTSRNNDLGILTRGGAEDDRISIRDRSEGVDIAEFVEDGNYVSIPNGNLNLSKNNLTDVGSIKDYYDSACGSNRAVRQVYPNGSYECTKEIEFSQDEEGLPLTLEQNNTANQSIDMDGNNIEDVSVINYSQGIRIGRRTKTNDFGIAIGRDAKADGGLDPYNAGIYANETAVGTGTEATGWRSTAYGADAEASSGGATAVGFDARSTALFGTALGQFADAEGERSTSVGFSADSLNYGTTSVGVGSQASGNRSISIGYQSNTTAAGSIAIGSELNGNTPLGAKATAEGAVAIGPEAKAVNPYEATFGNLNGQELDINVTGNLTVHGEDGLDVENGNIGLSNGQKITFQEGFANRWYIGRNAGNYGYSGNSIDITTHNSPGQKIIMGNGGTPTLVVETDDQEVALPNGDLKMSSNSIRNVGMLNITNTSSNTEIATFEESGITLSQPLSVESPGPLSVSNGLEMTDASSNTIESYSNLYLETSPGSNSDIVLDPDDGVSVKGNLSMNGAVKLAGNNVTGLDTLKDSTESEALRFMGNGNVKAKSNFSVRSLKIDGYDQTGGKSWEDDGAVYDHWGSQHIVIDRDDNEDLDRYFSVRADGSTFADSRELLKVNESGNIYIQEGNLSLSSNQINNVADPTESQDAATKSYVDSIGAEGLSETLEQNNTANQSIEFSNQIQIGNSSTVASNDSIAIGKGAKANNNLWTTAGRINQIFDSLAIGTSADASDSAATAVGIKASAASEAATALGRNAEASNQYATALGESSLANSKDATAVGAESQATGQQSTALGQRSEASGNRAVAVGLNSFASGYRATSIGRNSKANQNAATALGENAEATAKEATALGRASNASSQGAVAIGYESTAPNSYEATFGNLNGQELDVNVTGSLTVHGSEGADLRGNDLRDVNLINPKRETLALGSNLSFSGGAVRGIGGITRISDVPVEKTVDSFEDQDLSEYDRSVGTGSISSQVIQSQDAVDGDHALNISASDLGSVNVNHPIHSGGGLPSYPKIGNSFQYFTKIQGTNFQSSKMKFAQKNASSYEQYVIEISNNDQFFLGKQAGYNSYPKSDTGAFAYSKDQWYRVEVDRYSNGTIYASIYQQGSNSPEAKASINDKEYNYRGIGMSITTNANSGTAAALFDGIEVTDSEGITLEGDIDTTENLNVTGNLTVHGGGGLDLTQGSLTGVGATQCGDNEFIDGDGQCETVSSAGGGTENLETTLEAGNSAGNDNIDMNGQDINNINQISGNSAAIKVSNNVDLQGNSVTSSSGEVCIGNDCA